MATLHKGDNDDDDDHDDDDDDKDIERKRERKKEKKKVKVCEMTSYQQLIKRVLLATPYKAFRSVQDMHLCDGRNVNNYLCLNTCLNVL